MQAQKIAERAQIPGQFLGQIFQELKRAEIVASKRGPGGGYFLVAPAEELTLARILEALEDLPEVPEVARERSCGESGGVAAVADEMCGEVVERMVGLWEEVTIADLVERGEALGVPRQGYEGFVYVI